MALAKHEVFQIWLIQAGISDSTPELAIERTAKLMDLKPAEVTDQLKDILMGLLYNLPDNALDDVLPNCIWEHYGVKLSPPTRATADERR